MKLNFVIPMVLLAVLLLAAGCGSPPEDVPRAQTENQQQTQVSAPMATTPEDLQSEVELVPVDLSKSSFEFEGYAPGKSHLGSFERWDATLEVVDGKVVGVSGLIAAMSVDTGIDGLNTHLKSDDFFDVEVYPDIIFEQSTIANGQMTGMLTFHGVTNQISFPVTVNGTSVSADFLLDTTDFEIKYTGINKDVRIFFTMSA